MFTTLPLNEVKSTPTTHALFNYLVLSGGGPKGVYHLSVFSELKRLHLLHPIRAIAGSSIGAFMGCGIALGHDPDYLIEKTLQKQKEDRLKRYNDFISESHPGFYHDHPKDCALIRKSKFFYNAFKSTMNIIPSGGVFYGHYFEEVCRELIQEKFPTRTSLTFQELHDLSLQHPDLNLKDLYVTAVNVESGKLEIFSWKSTPNMPIPIAIHCSMAIPFLYKPVEYNKKYYVDGGVLYNLPLHIFDHDGKPNPKTLGVNLSLDPSQPMALVDRIYCKLLTWQNRMLEQKEDRQRILILNTNKISTMEFDLSAEKTAEAIQEARTQIRPYLQAKIQKEFYRLYGLYSLFAPQDEIKKFLHLSFSRRRESL